MNKKFIIHDSKYHGFEPQKCNFSILSVHEKIRYGLENGLQYCRQRYSDLAKTHALTDTSLQYMDQRTSSVIVSGDLDPVEQKYILVGKSCGGLAIYDSSKSLNKQTLPQIAIKRRGSRGTHKNSVTCCQWYPMDAGLFTTSSTDNLVKIWDPNSMKNVDTFTLSCNVCHHHMSSVASKHSILAAAGQTGEIMLCDLRTGSSTHRLHGHESNVQVVQWARHDQNCLASGGKDKSIRLWDVRSGKACLQVLGDSTDKRKVPVAHKGLITSLCFTHDGLWLLSYSCDGSLKVWNTSTGKNLNVRFGSIDSVLNRVVPLSITRYLYPDLVYIPSKNRIFVYEILSGALVNILSGHFASVLGTMYNHSTGDLYSYGVDMNFLFWTPRLMIPKASDDETDNVLETKPPTADSWSSDED